MFKDRKRGRALPPNGWIGENKALKKRQVKNVIKTREKMLGLTRPSPKSIKWSWEEWEEETMISLGYIYSVLLIVYM